MEARKLLNILMAAAPIMLMAGIATHSRTFDDPFQWPQVSEDHKRVQTYLPIVLQTQKLMKSPMIDATEAQTLARNWIDGANNGSLRPLVPVMLDESTGGRIRARIIDTNQALIRILVSIADEQIEKRDFQGAAQNLVLATDTGTALKYSNHLSVYRYTLTHHSVLMRIQKVYPNVDTDSRKSLAEAMNRMKADEDRLEKIAIRLQQLVQSEQELNREIHSLESSQPEPLEASFFEHPAQAKGEHYSYESDADSAIQVSELLSLDIRQCKAADERNRLMIRQIMSLAPNKGFN